MTVNQFQTGSGLSGTPYVGVRDLLAFLIGVPMTKGINQIVQASFTAGGIHAYGFRNTGWGQGELGTTIVYSGTRYDGSTGIINQVVYKYFEPASFPIIRTVSYIWFFTRTPLSVGQAALNAA